MSALEHNNFELANMALFSGGPEHEYGSSPVTGKVPL